MKVKIKKLHPDAIIPQYAKPGDAGMDLTATSKKYDSDGNVMYGTGLAFEIPQGYVGLLFPRSSNAKKDLLLANSVGVVDSGYRGEVLFKFKPSPFYTADEEYGHDTDYFGEITLPQNKDEHYEGISEYSVGDRIGQIIIMPYPQVTFEEVAELSTTERSEAGFGSTGV
jgi:dUTP pyrophosphatase